MKIARRRPPRPQTCDVCMGKLEPYTLPIKDIYALPGVKFICEPCGAIANSFVNFYGPKPAPNLRLLKGFLTGGIASDIKYSQLINAGYYENINTRARPAR